MDWVRETMGADTAVRGERIQSLWSGYGEIVRVQLTGAPVESVVVKDVRPPSAKGLGRGELRSHERKLRSYAVETHWYEQWSARCDERCRVPRCLGTRTEKGRWQFVLEDLDTAGFPGRGRELSDRRMQLCLRWLAAFHATFLGERPRGLWKVGTYWHLATRPDELEAMDDGALQWAAPLIDRRLTGARFRTLVHGDAKPANFCFSTGNDAVAGVDFQYVGGGCGMKDVAYLLGHEESERRVKGLLDHYFAALRKELGRRGTDVDPKAVEAEWRSLYPFAWADYHRFLSGWAPNWSAPVRGRALTRQVIRSLE